MKINNIKNVSGLITFISENSGWSPVTVANAASALGYRKTAGWKALKGFRHASLILPSTARAAAFTVSPCTTKR
jgi:hypothetical protein